MQNRIFPIALALASMAILLLSTTIWAANTTISGTVPSSLTVIAPGTITMPQLVPGTTQTSAAQTVTINANTNWTLEVIESGTSPDGKMENGDIVLGNELKVDGGTNGNPGSLRSTVTLNSGLAGANSVTDIVFIQQVAISDAPGPYSIIVTFTATGG